MCAEPDWNRKRDWNAWSLELQLFVVRSRPLPLAMQLTPLLQSATVKVNDELISPNTFPCASRQGQLRSMPNLSGVCLDATSAGRPSTTTKRLFDTCAFSTARWCLSSLHSAILKMHPGLDRIRICTSFSARCLGASPSKNEGQEAARPQEKSFTHLAKSRQSIMCGIGRSLIRL